MRWKVARKPVQPMSTIFLGEAVHSINEQIEGSLLVGEDFKDTFEFRHNTLVVVKEHLIQLFTIIDTVDLWVLKPEINMNGKSL